MADNVTTQSAVLATIPAGTEIATDDAGAAGHVQIVKLALSADGSATPITADGDGLEVKVTNGSPKGTRVSTVTAPTGAADLIVASNTDRIVALIQNTSAIRVGLTEDSGDTFAQCGHVLYEGDSLEDFVSTGDWYAVAESSTAEVRVTEVSA